MEDLGDEGDDSRHDEVHTVEVVAAVGIGSVRILAAVVGTGAGRMLDAVMERKRID